MVNLTINGKAVSVPEGTTILEAARQTGVHIPTLCYLKHLNEVGACRVCVVEVEGSQKLSAACNTAAEEGWRSPLRRCPCLPAGTGPSP